MKDYLPESPTISFPRVREIDTTDPVLGGRNGIDNLPHQDLADRTNALLANSATKAELKAHADATAPHGASAAAVASTLALRDAGACISVADPIADAHAVNKHHLKIVIDALGDNSNVALGLHVNSTAVHEATSEATANRIALRDASKNIKVGTPTDAAHAAPKTYVDTETAKYQVKIAAGTSGYLATHSGTAGTFGTPVNSAAWQKTQVPASTKDYLLTASGTAGTFGTPKNPADFQTAVPAGTKDDLVTYSGTAGTVGSIAQASLGATHTHDYSAVYAPVVHPHVGLLTDSALRIFDANQTISNISQIPGLAIGDYIRNAVGTKQILNANGSSKGMLHKVLSATTGQDIAGTQLNAPYAYGKNLLLTYGGANGTYGELKSPNDFAAATHTHYASEIRDGATAFAAYNHTHPPADLQAHTHPASDLTDGATVFAAKSHGHPDLAPLSHQHPASDLTDGATVFASKAHTHPSADVTDATPEATPNTILKRNAAGAAKVAIPAAPLALGANGADRPWAATLGWTADLAEKLAAYTETYSAWLINALLQNAITGVSYSDSGNDRTITFTRLSGQNPVSITVAKPAAQSVAVTGVSLDKSTLTLNSGNNWTSTITATITPNNATNKAVAWSTSIANVAIIASTSNNGLTATINGVMDGSATITATTADGSRTASCTVTVTGLGGHGPGDPSGLQLWD